MKPKGLVILTTVVLVCAVGMFVSRFMHWSVDPEQVSGDIAKSSRRAGKAASEASTVQLDALVDASLDAAGEIPEFAELLRDIQEAIAADTPLQEQGRLAERFIETADRYLDTTPDDTRLRSVRDQWAEYLQAIATDN